MPPGVLNIVHGTGADAGAPLTGHPDVDRVAFTGSPATARTVYGDAAAQPDAGLVRARRQVAVHRLRGRRPRRRRRYRRLPVRQLGAGVPGRDAAAGRRPRSSTSSWSASSRASAEIRVGDPRDAATTYGPLIHPVALQRVTGHVERALADGARLVFGGESLGGLYYAAHAVHRRPAGRRDPHPRGVRPGADAADVRRRGRGDHAGQRHAVRARGDRSTPALRAAPTGSAPPSWPGTVVGQLLLRA